jgi:hypothetical protein
VLIEAPSNAPSPPQSSRSNRAASSAVGTTKTGSRSRAASSRSRIAPARPEFGGPTMSEIGIRSQHRSAHGGVRRGDSRPKFPSGARSIFAGPCRFASSTQRTRSGRSPTQWAGRPGAWVDEIPDDELEAHYARAIAELDDHDISMLAAWHASMDVGHPVPNRDFLMGAFPSLGHNRREVLKLAAGFRGEEAVDAGVTEERALETVLEWLSPPRLMELAAEAVELYVWDRVGSDN